MASCVQQSYSMEHACEMQHAYTMQARARRTATVVVSAIARRQSACASNLTLATAAAKASKQACTIPRCAAADRQGPPHSRANECHFDPTLPCVLRTVRQRIPAQLALWCSALLEQLHRQRARCVQLRQWCAPRVPRAHALLLCPHRAVQMRLGSRTGCQPHLCGMHNKQMGLAPHLRGMPTRRRTSCSACRRVLVSRDRDRCIYRIGLWHAR